MEVFKFTKVIKRIKASSITKVNLITKINEWPS